MKITGGMKEDGVVTGNTYDKYSSKNPVVRWMMNGFNQSVSYLVSSASPATIHEIGCGEGYWVMQWTRQGYDARGSDFSSLAIELARSNAKEAGLEPDAFKQLSIYDVNSSIDAADLIVCCEVMEHLECPEDGLKSLQGITEQYLLLSVPREPVWRALNMLRGKYLADMGNTPGHIQHWSSKSFIHLISEYFDIIDVKKPFPWTMILCRKK
jgi:2-polyprenyl-3-methyl-5-hydroxy-6-metoxy-1,4-benzoquinol methylase